MTLLAISFVVPTHLLREAEEVFNCRWPRYMPEGDTQRISYALKLVADNVVSGNSIEALERRIAFAVKYGSDLRLDGSCVLAPLVGKLISAAKPEPEPRGFWRRAVAK